MSKENQNNLSPNPVREWRKYALEHGCEKAKTIEVTEEDINILNRSIAVKARENKNFGIRSINAAKEFFVD